MVKRRLQVAVLSVVVGALTISGVAAAEDRQAQRTPQDPRAFCERLESVAHALRARIGEIQAVQERIRAKIASGELTPRQEARAKHALRKLEALQQELQMKLERVLELLEEKC